MAPRQRSRSGKKNNKMPTEFLLLAVLVLGIIFFLIRGRNSTSSMSMSAETAPEAPSKGTQVQMLASDQPMVDVRKYQEELNLQRARFAQADALGLKSMPLKAQGDNVSIPLVFEPRKLWCQGGDLDTMKYATKNDDTKNFLITLEGIDRGGKNPFVRTSLRQLYKGVNYTFTVPRPKEPTSYGLYICSDSRRENSCQRKGMESHARLSEELAENPDKAQAQDRIFYFQNLVIDGKKVEAYRTDDFSTDFQRSISGHLTKKGLSASEVQNAWKANSILKSTPADIRNGRIVLSLPYNDPRCMQGKGKAK